MERERERERERGEVPFQLTPNRLRLEEIIRHPPNPIPRQLQIFCALQILHHHLPRQRGIPRFEIFALVPDSAADVYQQGRGESGVVAFYQPRVGEEVDERRAALFVRRHVIVEVHFQFGGAC
jgi:hypothetical protein